MLRRYAMFLILLLSMFFLAGLKYISEKKIEHATKRVHADSLTSSEMTFDVYECLFDFIVESKSFYRTLEYVSNVKGKDLDSHMVTCVKKFANHEAAFDRLTKKLLQASKKDSDLRKLMDIMLEFRLSSKKYIDGIVLISRGNHVEGAALIAPIQANCVNQWNDLCMIFYQVSLKNNLISENEAYLIESRLRGEFQDVFAKFADVAQKEGLEAALKLEFPNGGWLAIQLLISVKKSC
jgi:hypothetical protein